MRYNDPMPTFRMPFLFLHISALLVSCGGPSSATVTLPGGQKTADLLAAGACPLQVVAVEPGGEEGAFTVTLRNRSDSLVGAVRWGAQALGEGGQPLMDRLGEGSYDEGLIGPGESVQAEFAIPGGAAGARVVIRNLNWYTPDPLGGDKPPVPHVWRNPLYEIQLRTGQGISGAGQ